MIKDRPLNKREQKLFVRLYAASLLHNGVMHMIPASEKEEEGIDEEVTLLCEKLIGIHQSFATVSQIIEYIKGLRK
ncbi:hypothetical protein QMK33_00380 [Hymenobacter sp. H14-R3]|uniref:hypothetical protein n=1 Tax=Hymenobacter sp. H14-R3 TaxID=3046308 RepID=UPI0024BAA4F3|nr:hypothetical protein [Hymenobacter sp. H14-R3]MDJ0363590.1 hypothetical protein [Hymenobacter sp. H14-R3]